MRILVFDNDFVPADADRFPRWAFRGDRYRRAVAERLEGRGDRVRPRADGRPRPTARTGSNTATGTPTAAGTGRSATSAPTTAATSGATTWSAT